MVLGSGVGFSRPMGLAKEATMKDIRCLVGVHAWKKRHVEDSAYIECRRCGQPADAPTRGPMGTGRGLGF